mmetsp:Transcript_78060/g.121769  ORF Transcript_78060/g.121769 Transcript_78060/m.121769 type:complete len:85 (+) Transcript_78060:885-1139(+)
MSPRSLRETGLGELTKGLKQHPCLVKLPNRQDLDTTKYSDWTMAGHALRIRKAPNQILARDIRALHLCVYLALYVCACPSLMQG